MNELDKALAIKYCWITFNLLRPHLPINKDTTVKIKSDRVQELQQYEKDFVSKVKRNK